MGELQLYLPNSSPQLVLHLSISRLLSPTKSVQEETKLEQTEFLDVLKQLDNKRILLTVKGVDHLEANRYEIFHDILAEPILNWSSQYLLDKKLKEEEKNRDF